jgi:hypothetical protein
MMGSMVKTLKMVLVGGALLVSQGVSAGLLDVLDSIAKDVTAALEVPVVSGVEAVPKKDAGDVSALKEGAGSGGESEKPLTEAGKKALEAMRLQAAAALVKRTKSCTALDYSFLKSEDERLAGQVGRKEFVEASATAALIATNYAQCAMVASNPLAAAERVGYLLAVAAVYGMGGSVGLGNASRAMALLEYADTDSAREAIAQLNKRGYVKKKTDEKKDTKEESVALKGTAKELAQEFLGNKFAFNKKFTGKVIEAKGVVERVIDQTPDASLQSSRRMAGLPPSKPSVSIWIPGVVHDDELKRAGVMCDSDDAKTLEKVMDIKSGQQVRVRGVYEPSQWEVKLKSCVLL